MIFYIMKKFLKSLFMLSVLNCDANKFNILYEVKVQPDQIGSAALLY